MYNNNEITTQRSVKYETNPINSEFTGISIWLTLYCMVPTENVLSLFHPLIGEWFQRRYGEPTEVQRKAWPVIAEGRHILMTAPTGSGKTLSAFLWGLNQLITERWTTGRVRILYISPLRALNNDIRINLRGPLSELREQFLHTGEPFPEIGVQTRSGDTPPAERQRMLRRPPEILVTTPERYTQWHRTSVVPISSQPLKGSYHSRVSSSVSRFPLRSNPSGPLLISSVALRGRGTVKPCTETERY